MMRSLIVLLLLAVPWVSQAADIDLASTKCTPKETEVQPRVYGIFLPIRTEQFISVTRQSNSAYDHTNCFYQASVQVRQPGTTYFIPHEVWSWTGPGQIFVDGLWVAQPHPTNVWITKLHLPPSPKDQILVTFMTAGETGAFTGVRLFDYTSAVGNVATLLSIGARGTIKVDQDGASLVITARLDMGNVGTVRLGFDRDTGALAVENPTPESIALWRYLLSNRDVRPDLKQ